MMQFKAHKVNVTSERHLAEEAHNHSIAAKRRAENLCKMEWYYHDNLLKLLKKGTPHSWHNRKNCKGTQTTRQGAILHSTSCSKSITGQYKLRTTRHLGMLLEHAWHRIGGDLDAKSGVSTRHVN